MQVSLSCTINRTSVLSIIFLCVQSATAQSFPSDPPSLSPGATYHFAFVTLGATTANSGNVADYNSFVNSEAAASTAFSGLGSVNWNAVVSTFDGANTVNAIDNAPISGEVFLLDGITRLATGETDLWDGSLENSYSIDQNLDTYGGDVWTGTQNTGAAAAGFALGDIEVIHGLSGATGGAWINASVATASVTFPVYAVSDPLTVVPEPSVQLLGLIALATWAFSRVNYV